MIRRLTVQEQSLQRVWYAMSAWQGTPTAIARVHQCWAKRYTELVARCRELERQVNELEKWQAEELPHALKRARQHDDDTFFPRSIRSD